MKVWGLTESKEDDEQTPVIQRQLAEYKACALIGIEYAVELRAPGVETKYACVVCDKVYGNFWVHWSSFKHRLKYLEKHYPTVVRKYRPNNFTGKPHKESKVIVEVMAEAIENFHGRLQLKSMHLTQFENQRKMIVDNIVNGFHYDEKFGPDFSNVVEEAQLQLIKVKKEPEGHPKKNQQQSLSHQFVVNDTDNRDPTLQTVHPNQEKHKWEQYRFMLEKRLEEITRLQRGFVESPETHPLYSEEWDMFWVRRYKQLKAENKVDPKTYDYKPEWMIYWTKRMNELFGVEVEKAKKEIKFGLALPEEAEESYHQRYQLQTKTSRTIDDHAMQNIPVPVFSSHSMTHSRSLAHHGRDPQLRSRTRSRSRSPTRFEHELPQNRYLERIHPRAHSRDDYNSTSNGKNNDDYYKPSSSRYCDSAIAQTSTSTSKFNTSLAGRNPLKTYTFSGAINQVPEQQFIDSYRKSSTTLPGCLQQPDSDRGRKDMYTQRRTAYYVSDKSAEELPELETSAFKGAQEILVRHDDGVEASVANDRHIRTLAVVDWNVDDGGITEMKWKSLEKDLIEALMEVLKRNHGPVAQFRDAGWYQGRIKLIKFKDERSPLLYQKALKSLGQIWRGASLDLVALSQVPNRPRTFARVPSKPSRPTEILELIQSSNPHLPTHNWKVVKVSFGRTNGRLTITINGESIPLLDKTGGTIRYGAQTIKLRVYHEDA